MRDRLSGYKKVASSGARRLDGRVINIGNALSKEKMMVTSEFNGIEFKQTGQFKLNSHPQRVFIKKVCKAVQL